MSSKAQKTAIKDLICYIIMFVIMFGIGKMTPAEPLTVKGMQLLGLLAGCIWGWSVIGLIGPSLIAILRLGYVEGMTVAGAISSSVGNYIVVFMLLIALVVQMAEDEHLPKLMVDATMKMKIFQGRPALFSFALLFVTIVLGIINMFLAIFFMWSIIYELSERYGYQAHDPYPTVMCIGIVMMATMGLIAFPFQDNGLIIMGAYTGMVGEQMNYAHYLAVMVPIVTVLAAIWILGAKYVLRVDFSKLAHVDTSHLNAKATPRQKAAIFIVVFMMVALVAQTNIKAGFLGQILSNGTTYITGVAFYLLGTLWVVEGRPMMDYRTLIKGVPWESWWLTAVVMALGSMLTAADTGVTKFCVGLIAPVLGGLSPWTVVLVICFAAFIMTNFCNNIVVTICMIPILMSLAPVIGFNFEASVIMVILSAHFALFTPAASGPAGLMFANKDWVASKDIYTKGLFLLLACFVFTITIGYLWANIIF